MSRTTRLKKPKPSDTTTTATTSTPTDTTEADTAEKLKADTDALLDEIEGVLEENAAEFVAAYIQRGGQ